MKDYIHMHWLDKHAKHHGSCTMATFLIRWLFFLWTWLAIFGGVSWDSFSVGNTAVFSSNMIMTNIVMVINTQYRALYLC